MKLNTHDNLLIFYLAGLRKDEARPLAGVSALCSPWCCHIVGWVTRRTSGP